MEEVEAESIHPSSHHLQRAFPISPPSPRPNILSSFSNEEEEKINSTKNCRRRKSASSSLHFSRATDRPHSSQISSSPGGNRQFGARPPSSDAHREEREKREQLQGSPEAVIFLMQTQSAAAAAAAAVAGFHLINRRRPRVPSLGSGQKRNMAMGNCRIPPLRRRRSEGDI